MIQVSNIMKKANNNMIQDISNKEYVFNHYRYKKFDKKLNNYLLTTDFSTYIFLTKEEFKQVKKEKILSKELFIKLEENGIIITQDNIQKIILMINKRYSFLENGTSLHIVVPTSRCNLGCTYCFASPDFIGEDKSKTDMTHETARKTVEFIMKTPSNAVTIEFTGGEALIRFDIVKEIVLYAKELNNKYKKNLEFALVSNLTIINDEIVDWLIDNDVSICTSLDGTKEIHDENRHIRVDFENKNTNLKTYETVIYWIKKINKKYKEKNINKKVNALLTTTKFSLGKSKQIIDLYQELEINSIYLRSMGYIGRALDKENDKNSYSFEEFKQHYTSALKYIKELNKKNPYVYDSANKLFKQKIIEKKPGFNVDFENPWGAATGSLTYFSNGDIYSCHEAIGKEDFKLGNINTDSFETLFKTKETNYNILSSILESDPLYDRYVYKAYSGSSPIENFFKFKKVYVHPKKTMKYHEADFFSEEIFNELYNTWLENKKLENTST